jgi:hypothetical protein
MPMSLQGSQRRLSWGILFGLIAILLMGTGTLSLDSRKSPLTRK